MMRMRSPARRAGGAWATLERRLGGEHQILAVAAQHSDHFTATFLVPTPRKLPTADQGVAETAPRALQTLSATLARYSILFPSISRGAPTKLI